MLTLKIQSRADDHIRFQLILASAGILILTSLFGSLKAGFAPTFSTAKAYGTSNYSVSSGFEVGPATSNLINNLQKQGLDALAVGEITREFFSPVGTIVSLRKDNIKVFEYKSKSVLSQEVSDFENSAETTIGSWKKDVHLYADMNLVVFYMGEKETILRALNTVFGGEATKNDLIITSVSK